MKLITAVTKPEASDKAELEAAANTPFVDFLASRGLGQNLQTFIMYSIAMIGPDQRNTPAEKKISTSVGLESMLRFLRSLGRYGNTPLIYPLFGISDLVQAFCRFAAVYGTVYMLDQPIDRLLVDAPEELPQPRRVVGIVSGKQVIRAPVVIANMDRMASFVDVASPVPEEFISRLVCSVDRTLDPEGKDVLLFASIPPLSFGNPDTIYLMQLDPSTNCCPPGRFLVQIWTQGSATSMEALKSLASILIKTDSSAGDDMRPKSDWTATFDARVRASFPKETLPHGLAIVPDPGQAIDPDSCFQIAKAMFLELFPDLEFIPEVPHPDDVKWGGDEEQEQPAEPTADATTAAPTQESAKQEAPKPQSDSPAETSDFPAPTSFD